MSDDTRVGDVGRIMMEEQRSAFSRWSDAADRYTENVGRLLEGEVDPMEFSRDLLAMALRESMHTAQSAVRIGMGCSQWVAGLAGMRLGGVRREAKEAPGEEAPGDEAPRHETPGDDAPAG